MARALLLSLLPVDVPADYEKTIYDELDLLREAANASQLKRNFEGSPLLYVLTKMLPGCMSAWKKLSRNTWVKKISTPRSASSFMSVR